MDEPLPRNPEQPCEYTVQTVGTALTMKIRCGNCNKRYVIDHNCFTSLLRAFANEHSVEDVTLTDGDEAHLPGRILSTLKAITALSYEMRQLSMRTPTTPTGDRPRACAGCNFNPQKIFIEMNEAFLQDLGGFYSYYHDKMVSLLEQEVADLTCGECLLATREDFDYIYSRFEALLRDIIHSGAVTYL